MGNREISRRDFLRLSAVAAAGAIASACAPAAAPKEEAPEKELGARREGETISVSHWWGKAFTEGTQVFPMFTEMTGVAIEEQATPWSEYHDKAFTQLVGGVGPDVIELDAYFSGQFFRKGIVVPYDDALAAFKVDMSKWATDPKTENSYQDKIYGLSLFFMQQACVWVNKDLADEVGITIPEWGDDLDKADADFDTWKWADFVEWLRAGTKTSSDGTVEQYGIGHDMSSFWGIHRYAVKDAGGQIYDDPWSYEETECTINSPECVAGITKNLDLVLKENVAPTMEASNAIEGGWYRAGKALCTVSWSAPNIFEETGFNQSALCIPWDNTRVLPVGANFWSVNKASDKIDIGQEFAILTTTDWDLVDELLWQVNPAYDARAHLDAFERPEWSEERFYFFRMMYELQFSRSLTEGMSNCDACNDNVELYPRWYGGKVPGIFRDTVNAGLQSALIGEKSVQEAMDDAKAKIDEELAAV
jgi:ABC-type glycerol-3-phosphate transport system substrate-binding protein